MEKKSAFLFRNTYLRQIFGATEKYRIGEVIPGSRCLLVGRTRGRRQGSELWSPPLQGAHEGEQGVVTIYGGEAFLFDGVTHRVEVPGCRAITGPVLTQEGN
jgi:hypothetical protein